MRGLVDGRHPTPLVGRDRELRNLSEALEGARLGRGRVMLLGGEPGIGKSRLCEEIAIAAREAGMLALSGRAFEWAGAPAYWPWRQVFEPALENGAVDGLVQSLGARVAPLATIFQQPANARGDPEAARPFEPEHDRFQLFEAASVVLRHLSVRRPLLAILDDLHWADISSLLLLEFLPSAIVDSPIMLLGTYRDTEVVRGGPLARMLGNLTREPNAGRLSLQRLSRADVAEFAASLSDQPVPEEFTGKLHESSEGNPLFMTEIARMLTGEFGAGWASHAQAAAVRLPDSIRDMILMRLDRLPGGTNEALAAAAVLGREFSVAVLGAMTGFGGDASLAALEPALRAAIIEPTPTPGTFRFSHVLIQNAIYNEIGPAERARLHLRAAEALENLTGRSSDRSAELAYHYLQSVPVGDAGRAIQYAVRAGDQAMRQVAWESAIEQYERALSLVDSAASTMEDELYCDILLSLGMARWRSGQSDEARDAFRSALEIAQRLESVDRRVRAVLGIAGSDILGVALRDPQIVGMIEDALAELGPGDSPLRVLLLCQLIYLSALVPETLERRQDYGEEALAMARRIGDVPALLQALDAAWYAYQGPDTLAERAALADEQMRVAEHAGDRHATLMAHGGKAEAALLTGDLGVYAHHIDMYWQLARELKLPVHLLGAAHMWAALVAVQGNLEEARRRVEQIPIEHLDALPNRAGHRLVTLLLLIIYREQDCQGEIADRLDGLGTGVNAGSELYFRLEAALTLLEIGDPAPAREALELLTPDALNSLARDGNWLPILARVTDIALALEDFERAAVVYTLFQPYPHYNITGELHWVCYGSVSHWLGLIAAALGRFDAAEQHFEDALAMHERMGAHLFSTQTRVAWARMLVQRSRTGDRDLALELTSQALATAREFGLVRLERLAGEIQAVVGATSPASTHGLSPRELEVLRLIAEGHSDREIGEALSISHRTVMRHVTHILDKLGVNSRTAATAAALRQRII